MAINRNMQFNTTRLRDTLFAYIGHAMPFGLGIFHKKVDAGVAGVGICFVPLFIGADGLSVPISRGSPPTPD